jgi:hypothetical protein
MCVRACVYVYVLSLASYSWLIVSCCCCSASSVSFLPGLPLLLLLFYVWTSPWSEDGTMAIVPLSAKGAAMPEEPALLRNDRVPILDFAWNPFNNHVFATSDQSALSVVVHV